jgi:hypothetical protein
MLGPGHGHETSNTDCTTFDYLCMLIVPAAACCSGVSAFRHVFMLSGCAAGTLADRLSFGKAVQERGTAVHTAAAVQQGGGPDSW